MATKCTMLIQLGTTNAAGRPARLGGWSESWYSANAFGPSLINDFVLLAQKRAAILPTSAVIVGFRFQQTNGLTSGSSESLEVTYPGTSGIDNDAPQVALKFPINADGGPNKRIVILRGIPDIVVVRGEYAPPSPFRANMNSFLSQLASGWAFRGQTLTAPSTAIVKILADGTFTTQDVITIPPNVMVKVLRTRNAAGRQKGGLYKMLAVVGASGTIQYWNHGDCTSGRIRQYLIFFPPIPSFPNSVIPQVVIKKVGRPFNQYRGRKPVKSPG